MAEQEIELAEPAALTDSEKLDFLYAVAVKADKLLTEVGPQIVPILEGVSKNPMMKMFLR